MKTSLVHISNFDTLEVYKNYRQLHSVCGESFSPDHAMICHHGGLTFVRHNEIRDITAEWLEHVCHDVVIKPHCSHLPERMLFQPLLTGKMMLELIYMPVGSGVAGRVPF